MVGRKEPTNPTKPKKQKLVLVTRLFVTIKIILNSYRTKKSWTPRAGYRPQEFEIGSGLYSPHEYFGI